MEEIRYFHQFKLVPINGGNGSQTIMHFFEDPLFVKKVEISNGQIIVQRICPYGHPSPVVFSAKEFSIVGNECSPPENG